MYQRCLIEAADEISQAAILAHRKSVQEESDQAKEKQFKVTAKVKRDYKGSIRKKYAGKSKVAQNSGLQTIQEEEEEKKEPTLRDQIKEMTDASNMKCLHKDQFHILKPHAPPVFQMHKLQRHAHEFDEETQQAIAEEIKENRQMLSIPLDFLF